MTEYDAIELAEKILRKYTGGGIQQADVDGLTAEHVVGMISVGILRGQEKAFEASKRAAALREETR